MKDNKLMPYKRMVDRFKQYFVIITFEHVPKINNRAVDAMEIIGSLLDIPQNIRKYEFLVEQLLIPTFDILKS